MSELPHILQRSRQSVLYRHGQHFRKNATSKKRNDSVVSLNRSAKKTQQVRAAESGHHYRRNCGLGRTEKHAVAITSGSTLLSPSPKTLFVAQTTHMAGGDSWAHESNHRLDYHSTKGAPTRVRSGIEQGVATTTCIHLLSLCAGPTIIQSKRLPFRRKKKAYVYI